MNRVGGVFGRLAHLVDRRADAAAPISAFMRFRDNSELIATIYFEGDTIGAIDAMETLMVRGGARRRWTPMR